jgi:NADP-dependent 3-hydroxy acid dehydrogenase YdfG
MEFTNKVILLTGASKGIGRQLALTLADKGNHLGLVARSESELYSLQQECVSKGVKCLIFQGSVASENLVKTAVASMITEFGHIDFMINNAGYGIFGPTEDITAEQLTDLYDTNVKGTFLFSKEVLESMKTKGSGHIINIASDVAKRVFDGGALYCSSKFAQDAFSAALRKEVRKHGIKVSVIYSGLVDTPFHADERSERKKEWLTSQDMANTIIYVMNQPKHVVIDELMIHPLSQEY